MEDVPKTILNPINAWSDSDKYRAQADDLINVLKKTSRNSVQKLKKLLTLVALTNN